MKTKSNLHEGHRARLKVKFLENPSIVSDHELLEVLLYGALPRVDTNEIAHRLLKVFGSLSGVFSATEKELTCIEGVGKSAATAIMVVGKVAERLIKERANTKTKRMFSFYENKEEIIADLGGLYEEKVIIYLLDDKYRKISSIVFEDRERFSVKLDIPELAKAVAIHKPKFAIVAHNHPSGMLEPSGDDDFTTQRLCLLCSVHGVTLIDHVIVAGNAAFSYRQSGRLQPLLEKADIHKLLQ
jgi:DNA repair protein RadC